MTDWTLQTTPLADLRSWAQGVRKRQRRLPIVAFLKQDGVLYPLTQEQIDELWNSLKLVEQ